MKIAVCDDEETQRKKMSEYLVRYSEENMLYMEIDTFENGASLLTAFETSEYQIVFLDIYMKGISGVETAFNIRSQHEACAIVFITSSPDYRAEGFEVGATHYILKPVTYESLSTAMNRCKRLLSFEERFIVVTLERKPQKVRLKDVIYIEVYSKNVLLHTHESVLETRMPLVEIEQMLSGGSFLRCHRSFIVNMRLVVGVLEQDFLMKNNKKVPIRKNGSQKVKEEYNDYLFNSIREIST